MRDEDGEKWRIAEDAIDIRPGCAIRARVLGTWKKTIQPENNTAARVVTCVIKVKNLYFRWLTIIQDLAAKNNFSYTLKKFRTFNFTTSLDQI